MADSSIHLMIIWSKASKYKETIISRLDERFRIVKIFRVSWDKTRFVKNYRVFYSHSLREYDEKKTNRILWQKMRNCGIGSFYAIIFEDKSPSFEYRKTSSGERSVNINVFDMKMTFRQMVGGGSKIHASDDMWETNKDLTLLFGLNVKDFMMKYDVKSTGIEKLNRNCVGVNGYTNIEELFYVLNNCINYCILRNFECIPEQYNVEGHGDIDLLVENKNYMVRLTSAIPAFPQPYRVYHTIKISGKRVPFDFRYVGDNYYDYQWEQAILEKRVLSKELFYIPNLVNHYYSLLYHAFVQKRKVNKSYPPVLSSIAEKIGVTFINDVTHAVKQLDCFLNSQGYLYTKAKDKSVFLNKSFLLRSAYYAERGCNIKTLLTYRDGKLGCISSVIELNDSFVKKGDLNIIANEREKLLCLQKKEGFPVLLNHEDENILKLSKIEGSNAGEFFESLENHTFPMISSFILGALNLIMRMREKKIVHRDFQPSNIMVDKRENTCKLGLLDFGWAIFDYEIENCEHPQGLCKYLGYNYGGDYRELSDIYSLGRIIIKYWKWVPCYRRIANRLIKGARKQDVTIDLFKIESHLKNMNPGFIDIIMLSIIKIQIKIVRRLITIRNIRKVFFIR